MAFAKHTDKLQKFLLFVADSKPHRALSFDVTQCLYNRSAGRRFVSSGIAPHKGTVRSSNADRKFDIRRPGEVIKPRNTGC